MVSMNYRMDIDDVRIRIAQIMEAAGVNQALIYAFMKTGLLVCEDTPVTPEMKKEWEDACNEWYDMNEHNEGGE